MRARKQAFLHRRFQRESYHPPLFHFVVHVCVYDVFVCSFECILQCVDGLLHSNYATTHRHLQTEISKLTEASIESTVETYVGEDEGQKSPL